MNETKTFLFELILNVWIVATIRRIEGENYVFSIYEWRTDKRELLFIWWWQTSHNVSSLIKGKLELNNEFNAEFPIYFKKLSSLFFCSIEKSRARCYALKQVVSAQLVVLKFHGTLSIYTRRNDEMWFYIIFSFVRFRHSFRRRSSSLVVWLWTLLKWGLMNVWHRVGFLDVQRILIQIAFLAI